MEIRTFGGGGRLRECERTLTKQELAPTVEAITKAFAEMGICVK